MKKPVSRWEAFIGGSFGSAGPAEAGGDAGHGLHEGDGGAAGALAGLAEKGDLQTVEPVKLRAEVLAAGLHLGEAVAEGGAGDVAKGGQRGGMFGLDAAEDRGADGVVLDQDA